MPRRIVWNKSALDYFRESIDYIRKKSPKNAEKVTREVTEKIKELALRPEIHNRDKYKTGDNRNYRCFEMHRLRIGYLIEDDEIIIARIRNTRQEPSDY